MQEDIKDVVKGLRSDQSISALDEVSLRQTVIIRLLAALGWNQYDSNEVKPEYRVERRRPDYSLRINGENKIFIEVKRPSKDLHEYQEQLITYTAIHGVPLAVLTNGVDWWFYLPLQEGGWEHRRFCQLNLSDQGFTDLLVEFLARENVRSGVAVDRATARLAELQGERAIDGYLPEAWDNLVSDTRLFKLIEETVEKGCGYKPTPERIQRFLKALSTPPKPPELGGEALHVSGNQHPVRRRRKKPNLTFEMIDVPVGATLTFVEDPTIQCVVVDQVNHVNYYGQQYSLARLSANLKGYKAAQGALYWLYEDETLQQRRHKLGK